MLWIPACAIVHLLLAQVKGRLSL